MEAYLIALGVVLLVVLLALKLIADERTKGAALLEQQRQEAQRQRLEDRRLWEQQINELRTDIRATTAEQLATRQAELQTANRQQLGDLLLPVKEQFEAFQKAVADSSRQAAADKAKICGDFASTLRLFQEQQRATIEQLAAQTQRIGQDAVTLARALRGDTKRQGDWGEWILTNLLENSGLRQGIDFSTQMSVKDKKMRDRRPDVVLFLSGDQKVVVDAKVSLTAYTEYVAAFDQADSDTLQELLQRHCQSVRKHIDELLAKEYVRLVPGSIGYVLMFVPNESSYIAAVKHDPGLLIDAYRKQVIVLSPSNFLMALQLVGVLRQQENADRNVRQLQQEIQAMYEKFTAFTVHFSKIVDSFATLKGTVDDAAVSLYLGKGNLKDKFENFRTLGINSPKSPTLPKAQRFQSPDTPAIEEEPPGASPLP